MSHVLGPRVLRPRPRRAAVLLLAGLAAVPAARSSADEPAFEAFPPALASRDLPADLRSGPTFRVRDAGVTEAFLTTWEMESGYGLFVCPSTRLLRVRVHEVAAMAGVVGSDPTNEFLRGLQGRMADLPGAVVEVIEDPVGTLEGAAEGAKRTLGRVGDLFSGRKATKYEGGGLDDALFAQEKRKVAAELGVDVYSSNKKLQAFLGEIAKARRAGQFAVDLAKMAVTGPAGTAVSGLSMTGDLTALLRDRTPAELDRLAEEELARAGVMPHLRRMFLNDRALSPRHRTTISRAVARLEGVENRGALVAAAAESRTEAQAFLHEDQAAWLVQHHAGVEPLVRLDVTGGLVAGFTAKGTMFVPVPVDVLALVPEVPVAVDALLAMPGAAEAPARILRVAGPVTPAAAAYLAARGFTLAPR